MKALGFKTTDFFILFFLLINALKIFIFDLILSFNDLFWIKGLIFNFGTTFLFVSMLFIILFGFGRKKWVVAFYCVQLVYLAVNLIYFNYFKSYLYFGCITSLFSEGFFLFKNFSLPLWQNNNLCILLIDLPFLAVILFFFERLKGTAIIINRRLIVSSGFVFIFLIFSIVYMLNKMPFSYRNNHFTGDMSMVRCYGVLTLTIVDFISTDMDTNKKEIVLSTNKISGKPLPQKFNIILIQLESVDSNILNYKYNGKYIMPFLNSLTRKSIYYPYVLSYHMGGGTSDSEYAIINSVEPLMRFPAIKIKDYGYPNSMVKLFFKAGYETIAFHGNTGSFFNRNRAFLDMGYLSFFDINNMKLNSDDHWGANDESVFNYVVEYSKKSRRPFFYHIITVSSHEPFKGISAYYVNAEYDTVKENAVKNYYNSMSYVDKSIEKIWPSISNLKNTYIFIYGDHCPGITRSKIFVQSSFTSDGIYFEFVPLLIITPDSKIRRENKIVSSLLDFAPTILAASGIEYELYSDGRNLLESQLKNDKINFKGKRYEREFLFNSVSQTVVEEK